MTRAQKFLEDVEAFLEASGVKATTLGKGALGDPSFVFQLRKGRVPNLDIVDRVENFMREHDSSRLSPLSDPSSREGTAP